MTTPYRTHSPLPQQAGSHESPGQRHRQHAPRAGATIVGGLSLLLLAAGVTAGVNAPAAQASGPTAMLRPLTPYLYYPSGLGDPKDCLASSKPLRAIQPLFYRPWPPCEREVVFEDDCFPDCWVVVCPTDPGSDGADPSSDSFDGPPPCS